MSCFEFNEFCNPEMVEIFIELLLTNGCNPFRIDCKFAVAEIGNEFVVIVVCLESNEVCNPEVVEIFRPFTIPLKVALLHTKFPDGSTEKISFLKVPVKLGLLLFNFVCICNNKEAATF